MHTAIVNGVEKDMQKVMDFYKLELSKIRTGRANPKFIEGIKVDCYGNETAIKYIANITTPNAQTISIIPWDKNMIKIIAKAIMQSDLGLNPISEADVIRVPIPPLTEDRRKELVKMIKGIAEASRVSIRNIRRDSLNSIKILVKNNEISDDTEHRMHGIIQKITDNFIENIDEISIIKEKELMTI